MNARTFVLLKLLASGEHYTIEDISNEYGVSERFVRYIIDDSDFYLRSVNLPSICFDEDGVFLDLNPKQKKELLDKISSLDVYTYNLSASERQAYILLSLMCCTEPLKINFFSNLLNVSESSINKDVSVIKQKIGVNNLDIKNIAGKGIYLSGEEINIRCVFLAVISKYFDMAKVITNPEMAMIDFMERSIYTFVFEIYLKPVLSVLEKSESESRLKLSFLSFKDLCVYLVVMINRIILNRTVVLFEDHIDQIKETKSYDKATEICNLIRDEFDIGISESEVCYVCLMLEGSHYTASDSFVVKEWAAVQVYANQLIDKVSAKLRIDFEEDKELMNSLTLHLGLTSFKLHNNVPILNSESENIKKSYSEVFHAIKEALTENFQEPYSKLTNDDIAYLTLHFQAAIERKKKEERNYNILVVCIHGYGTASLMKELIVSKYKNINVKKIVTRNYIDKEDLKDVDFIVSSVELSEKQCPVVKVNAILKNHDYSAIEDVMNAIGSSRNHINSDAIEDIVSIISKNTKIPDKTKLKEEVESYLSSMGISNNSVESNSLYFYLNNLTLYNRVVEKPSIYA